MGRVYPEITPALASWIGRQPLFFVGSAPLSAAGHVNVSPKGPIGTLRVLGPRSLAYLDVVGSGAETAAHLQENGRITVMLCAFDGPPRILRLYGHGTVVAAQDPRFDGLRELCAFEEPAVDEARRAIVLVTVDRVADACGFGVPLMEFRAERENHGRWVRGTLAKAGPEAMDDYTRRHNAESIDGLPAFGPSGA